MSFHPSENGFQFVFERIRIHGEHHVEHELTLLDGDILHVNLVELIFQNIPRSPFFKLRIFSR